MFLDLTGKKILVVDDMPAFRSTLRNMLIPYGAANIHSAPDGDAAVSLVEKTRYDIILCDYNLGAGKKDGQQVLEELKGRGLISYATIFMMVTAESGADMVMGTAEYAPDDYLIKPLTEEIVVKRLFRMMEAKKELEPIETAFRNREFSRARAICDVKMKGSPRYLFDLLKIKGEICMSSGDYEAAEALYREVLEKRNISWAKLGLGKIAFIRKDFERAKGLFKEIMLENQTFVPAYDWMARADIKSGDLVEAKKVLIDAAAISPKYIPRQRDLGDVSRKTGDFDNAEKSYKKAVELGKNSYLKSPSDYTYLARVLVDKDASEEALSVAKEVRREFMGDRGASWQASLAEGMAYKGLDRLDDARKAIKSAADLFDKLADDAPSDLTIEMAKTCLELGEKDEALKCVRSLAGNHHDDEEVFEQIRDLFREASLVEEGEELLSSSINEVNQINKKGISLLEREDYQGAIDYFREAAGKLPGNRILTANVAHAALMYMQKNGRSREMIEVADRYLEKTAQIDPDYQRYHRLLEMYEKIVGAGSGEGV